MTALAGKRRRAETKFQYMEYVVASTKEVFHNGSVSFNGSGQVVPTTDDAGLMSIGLALTNPAPSRVGDGVAKVSVDLQVERDGEWFDNDADDAVTAADLGKMAYFLDDTTVTINGAGRSEAGRIWGVDAKKGVLIEANTVPAPSLLVQGELPAFVAAASAPASIIHDAVYVIPPTAANSSITLPAAAPDGTRAHFVGDGTAGSNGHTITFKDETGTVTLNTATTALKRINVTAVKALGFWTVGVTVAP